MPVSLRIEGGAGGLLYDCPGLKDVEKPKSRPNVLLVHNWQPTSLVATSRLGEGFMGC